MAALVIPNSAIIRLIWSMNGVPTLNVFGATWVAAPNASQALANALGSDIKGILTTSGLAACLNQSVALVSVGLRDISNPNQPEFLDNGASVVGTSAGEAMPNQLSMVLTLRTASAGKSYRGRIYLGGFTETDNTAAGQISTTCVNAGVLFVQQTFTAFGSHNLAAAVLSRPREQKIIPQKIIPAKTGWATPVTLVQSRNNLWETQRRRVD